MDVNSNLRNQHRKHYNKMRALKDIVMALIILTVGVFMFFGDKFEITKVLMSEKDPLIRYLFGGLCALYGGFRLYRGLKQDY